MSKEYPYICDFYIPEKDLYIEYQGFWTHGYEPFNRNNEKHLQIIKNWKSKPQFYSSKKKNKNLPTIYKFSIYYWTKLDLLKRKIVKENNLNYLEFFNIEQFLNWYNKL